MLDLSRYRAIIFDMDGTLIDSMGSHLQAWQMTCEHYAYPFELDFMHSLGGVPTRQTVVLLNQKFGRNHCPDEVAEKKHQLWLSLDHSPDVIQATCDILKHYKGKLKIGVGTGAERSHALEMLAKTGLIDDIDALVTASDVYQGKPHPETFLSVAQLLQAEPADCVVFEDTEIGRLAANAAMMDCILVKNGQIQPVDGTLSTG